MDNNDVEGEVLLRRRGTKKRDRNRGSVLAIREDAPSFGKAASSKKASRNIAKTEEGVLKHDNVESLKDTFLKYDIDFEFDPLGRKPGIIFRELYAEIGRGNISLVVEDHKLTLQTHEIQMNLMFRDMVLIMTHDRSKHCTAKLTVSTPSFMKKMNEDHADGVEIWLKNALGIDTTGSISVSEIRDTGRTTRRPSLKYPKVTEIHKIMLVTAVVQESAFKIMPVIGLPGGRPIIIQLPGEDTFRLCSWWPIHFWPSAMRQPMGHKLQVEHHPRRSFIMKVLHEVLSKEHGEFTDDPLDHLQAALRLRPNLESMLIAMTSPNVVCRHDLTILHIFETADRDQVSELKEKYHALQDALPGHVMRLVKLWEQQLTTTDPRIIVQHLAMDGASYAVPEYAAAVPKDSVMVVLEDIAQFAVNVIAGDSSSLADLGSASKGGESKTLTSTLAGKLNDLISGLSGIGGILAQMMSHAHRSSRDILALYKLSSKIEQHVTKRNPGLKGQEVYSAFHPDMQELIMRITPPDENFEKVDLVAEALHLLSKLETKFRRLENSSNWSRDQWRPFVCMAHGHLACSNVIVDALGSMYLYNFADVGEQPVLYDIASLSLSLLMDCCRLPITAELFVAIVEQDWIRNEDVAEWLQVHPAVAETLVEEFRKELQPDSDCPLNSSNKRERATALMHKAAILARKHLKLLETASDAEPVQEKMSVFKNLARQVVAGEFEMLSPFDEAFRLAEAWVRHLDVLIVPASMPPFLNGPRLRTWELQSLLFQGSSRAYSQVLKQATNLHGDESKILCIDTSPLLLEIPILEHALKLLSNPTVSPWQKIWICHLVVCLGKKIQEDLAALDKDQDSQLSPLNIASPPSPPRVQVAVGHRLFLTAEVAQGHGTEALPVTICEHAGSIGHAVHPNDPILSTTRVLRGWPCAALGVGIQEVQHIRMARQLIGENVDPRIFADLAIRTSMSGHEPELAQLRQWPKPESVADCSSMCYEVLEVVAEDASDDSVIVRDIGSSLLLKGVVLEDLVLQGRCVGWAASGDMNIRHCPLQSSHSTSTLVKPCDVYARFPCTSCGRALNLGDDDSADPFVVHCGSCWLTGIHSDLCPDCAQSREPLCPLQHSMIRLDESPYMGEVTCSRCHERIEPTPLWDQLNASDLETSDQPRWFHCRGCSSEDQKFDLCLSCASIQCPKGHAMRRLTHTRSTLVGPCMQCQTSVGMLNIWSCVECQDVRCEVVYPDSEAAKEDMTLTRVPGRSSGLQVLTVKRGGAAALAGVQSGDRLLTVNNRVVKTSPEFAFLGAKGSVLAEFGGACFDVKYEDSETIQKDLTIEVNGGAFVVMRSSAGGPAAKSGVHRGARLVSVNGKNIEEFKWDGIAMFDASTCTAPPYVFSFRPRGSEIVYHSACGIPCDYGHLMEAQCPKFLTCSKGHAMLPCDIDNINLSFEDSCESCGEVLLGTQSTVMWCTTCAADAILGSPLKQLGNAGLFTHVESRRTSLQSSAEVKPRHFFESVPSNMQSRRATVQDSGYHETKSRSEFLPTDLAKKLGEHSVQPMSAREPRLRMHESRAASLCNAALPFSIGEGSPVRLTMASMDHSPRNGSGLCWSCAEEQSLAIIKKVPYQNEGVVQCDVCFRDDLGCSLQSSEHDSVSNIQFFHCGECFKQKQKFDLCSSCMGGFLRCDEKQHQMECYDESPYSMSLSCVICDASLESDEEAYNCNDCWHVHGRRVDRCKRCAEQFVVEIALDSDARFQLLSREGPHMNVSWLHPGRPAARVHVAHQSLMIRLELRGFVYPPDSRLLLLGEGVDRHREGTICGRPNANGKYHVLLDGEEIPILYEPNITNHLPAGVWRYRQGQELVIFNERGWFDVRVRAVEPRGNSHLVEPLSTKSVSSQKGAQKVTLNTWNHSPLWLLQDAYCREQRNWNDKLLGHYSYAYDVVTGANVDVMSLLFNVCDHSKPAEDSLENLWPWILQFAGMSDQRHRGIHEACGVFLLGDESTGKTSLLKRIVMEALKDHMGEMVPLPIDGLSLVDLMGGPDECLTKLSQPSFLSAFLVASYGDGSPTGLFLQQALHSRRIFVLVDGVDKMPRDLRSPLLAQLGKLVDVGHRVLVVARPDSINALPRDCSLQDEDYEILSHALSLPPQFRTLWLMGLSEDQKEWEAEQKLGGLAPTFLASIRKYEDCAPGLCSTMLMFQLILGTPGLSEVFEKGNDDVTELHQEEQTQHDSNTEVLHAEIRRPSGSESKAELQRATGESIPRDAWDSVSRRLRKSITMPSHFESDTAEYEENEETTIEDSVRFQSEGGEIRIAIEEPIEEAAEEKVSISNLLERVVQGVCQQSAGDSDGLVVSALQLLAAHVLSKNSKNFSDCDIVEISCHHSYILEVWKNLQTIIKRNRFSLITCLDSINRKGERITQYRFASQTLQQYLASREMAKNWSSCPIGSLEEAISKEPWKSLSIFLAEQLPGPLVLTFLSADALVAQNIADFMHRSHRVDSLCLAQTRFGLDFRGVCALSEALASDRCLTKLDLSACALGSEGVAPMCLALQNHPCLVELSLKDNHLGQIGAEHISAMIATNRILRTLDLSYNAIGDDGIKVVVDALCDNRALEHINFVNNNISKNVEKHVSSALLMTEMPLFLDTRDNREGVPRSFMSPAAAFRRQELRRQSKA